MFKEVFIKSAIALLLIGATYLVGLLALTAIERNEIVECTKLERYSREYPYDLFYLTEWQSEMCTAHGFTINARIK